MVFAPATLQEAVDLTYNAWEYAERDRNPVLILMDGCLGAIMELVCSERNMLYEEND